ncbi:MAG: hypothetical protein V3T35_07215, partial [Spirochaetia bacterium]
SSQGNPSAHPQAIPENRLDLCNLLRESVLSTKRSVFDHVLPIEADHGTRASAWSFPFRST